MDPFRLNTYLRALTLAAILGLISFGILWGGGRLLRTSLGGVWWFRLGPKLAYFIVLMFGVPGMLLVRYGPMGLQVYVVAGATLAVILFFAGLLARS